MEVDIKSETIKKIPEKGNKRLIKQKIKVMGVRRRMHCCPSAVETISSNVHERLQKLYVWMLAAAALPQAFLKDTESLICNHQII